MSAGLNFATVPFRNERLPTTIYVLAAAALIAATVVHGVLLTRYLLREREELDDKVEQLRNDVSQIQAKVRQTQADLQSRQSEAQAERIQFMASVYRHKSFSWTGLFNELEDLIPPSVRITSIAPGALAEEGEEIEVNLQVVGRTLEDVLEMVRRLEANRMFTTVLPLSESEGSDRAEGGVAAALTLQFLPGQAEPPVDPETAKTEEEPAVEPSEEPGASEEDNPETGNNQPAPEVKDTVEEPEPPSAPPNAAGKRRPKKRS